MDPSADRAAAFDRFKADVRTWIEIDTSIRKLGEALRERRTAKRELTKRVLAFMAEQNIDELTTRSGRLRAQVSYVRAPISQQVLRERIEALYPSTGPNADADAAANVQKMLLGNREWQERTSLKRLGAA